MFNITPGNHQFIVAKQIEKVNSLGYDQSCHMTAFFVEFNIYDTSDFFTSADIDYIFFFQFTKSHRISPPPIFYAQDVEVALHKARQNVAFGKKI